MNISGFDYDPKHVILVLGRPIQSWDAFEIRALGDVAEAVRDTTGTPTFRFMNETRSEWVVTLGQHARPAWTFLSSMVRKNLGTCIFLDMGGTGDNVVGQFCTVIRALPRRRADEKVTYEVTIQCLRTEWSIGSGFVANVLQPIQGLAKLGLGAVATLTGGL